MSKLRNRLFFTLLYFTFLSILHSQTPNNVEIGLVSNGIDSLSNGNISLNADTTAVSTMDAAPAKKSPSTFITSEIKYTASDSIITVMDKQKVYLFKDAVVTYQDIELKAHFIELDLDKNEAFACGTKDSLNAEIGLPVFKDDAGQYEMRTMRYNFETKKAIIQHVVTEQGEGFIVSDQAKKMTNNDIYLKGGMYTTCANHDHPHFGLHLTKAKVIPGKKIVTGPAYLVIEDVPFPIGIPFGFVPSTQSYSSGFILPAYGEESNRGFFLREGGYYWAVNDYFDFQATGDIYTNLSWAVRAASKYNNRYQFSGNFKVDFITNIYSEKDLPDYSKSKDFSVNWNHRQDAKANPYQSVSASVDFSTSSFNQNNVTSIIDPNELATNTKRSSISYGRRWADSPFNLSVNLLHSQNSKDSTIDLTIPDLTLSVNRIYPFKNKNRLGSQESWYEKLSFSYSGTSKNYIHTKESELFDSNLNEDWQNGVKHTVPLSMNIKFLKYFTTSPTISYTERWYFNSIRKEYDQTLNKIVTTDTIQGFNRVYDFNYSIGTSTKIYTSFKPWRSIFKDKVDVLRHVMTPNVNLSYRPDFSEDKYGYYENIEYVDPSNGKTVDYEYSKYENSLYGTPGSGKNGSIGMGLGNTLEMKVKSDKDSTGYKKITILESLNLNSGYNFLIDEFRWSPISATARTKMFKTDINVSANFDPYALDSTGKRINESFYSTTGNLLRLTSANTGFGYNLSNETFKKKKATAANQQTNEAINDDQSNIDFEDPNSQSNLFPKVVPTNLESDDNGYAKFSMPWTLGFNYSVRLTEGTFNKEKMAYNKKIINTLSFNGSLTPTPKWSISYTSGYDFESKSLAYTSFNIARDLHCWSMSLNLVPIGKYKSYFFTIHANSSMLKDLKYEKRNSARDNSSFY